MDNRNRKYPIIHLCLGELGPHHPENLLCLGEAGSLHPEILYCPGEEDSLHLIIYLCPGEPSSLHEKKGRGQMRGTGFPCDARSGQRKESGAGRGTTFPRTPLSTASWMQRAPEKHPRLAASATWWSSCRSGKTHHTECRLLRTPGNKCQSHRPMILTVLSFLFTKKL